MVLKAQVGKASESETLAEEGDLWAWLGSRSRLHEEFQASVRLFLET